MNIRIERLLKEISSTFKSIYNRDISEISVNYNLQHITNLSVVNINEWTKEEVELALEGTLKGIDYYIKEYVKSDSNKYAFPFQSFNSVFEIIHNNKLELIIYTKRIPSFNEEFKALLVKKGLIS